MIGQPDGPELLATARDVLLNELLALLPADKRYEARMIANAMAIATRELQLREQLTQDHSEAIAAFYQQLGLERVDPQEATLVEDIRTGALNQSHRAPLQALLMKLTNLKLQLSNPKRVICA